MADTITIEALEEERGFAAYVAQPEGAAKAAIIVVQEIFGVNAGIRRKVEDWAALGYLALAPDMFWRFAPGYDVDPDIAEQAADAFKVREQFDADKAVLDIEATIRAARAMLGQGGKVGLVGFCMGGRCAYLAATRTDVDASAGYYGARIDQALDEAHAIGRPLLLHFAANDHFIPQDAVARIHAALDGNPHVTIVKHDGVDHGFADTFGTRRSDPQAQEADAMTRSFFAQHLG